MVDEGQEEWSGDERGSELESEGDKVEVMVSKQGVKEIRFVQDEDVVEKEDDVNKAEEKEDEDVEEVDKMEESVDVGSGRTVGESEVKVDVEKLADGVKVNVGSKDEEVLGLRGESEVQAVAGSGSEDEKAVGESEVKVDVEESVDGVEMDVGSGYEEVKAVGESDVQAFVGSESEESWSDEVYLEQLKELSKGKWFREMAKVDTRL